MFNLGKFKSDPLPGIKNNYNQGPQHRVSCASYENAMEIILFWT